jgi:NAD(P)-dependent dehydrogenase (short-subunit alcohol dehydrogenase family)
VEEGAYVFITGRRKEKPDEARQERYGRTGRRRKSADLDRLYETARRERGSNDILFASAGQGEFATLEKVIEEHFEQYFRHQRARHTLQRAKGAAVLQRLRLHLCERLGPIASVKGYPALGVYGSSKAALRSFARAWRVELEDRKIRVNVLSPGTIDMATLRPPGAEAKEEIATVALFLASSDSSFVKRHKSLR